MNPSLDKYVNMFYAVMKKPELVDDRLATKYEIVTDKLQKMIVLRSFQGLEIRSRLNSELRTSTTIEEAHAKYVSSLEQVTNKALNQQMTFEVFDEMVNEDFKIYFYAQRISPGKTLEEQLAIFNNIRKSGIITRFFGKYQYARNTLSNFILN